MKYGTRLAIKITNFLLLLNETHTAYKEQAICLAYSYHRDIYLAYSEPRYSVS